MTEYISNYITLKEYTCPCGECSGLPPMFDVDPVPLIYTDFFDDFSVIRNAWGGPLRIGPPSGGGGFRCLDYNASIGGALLSAHTFGLGLDPDVSNIAEVNRLDAIIEEVAPHLRRGKYTVVGSFIHIDCAFKIYPQARRSWVQGVRWFG